MNTDIYVGPFLVHKNFNYLDEKKLRLKKQNCPQFFMSYICDVKWS